MNIMLISWVGFCGTGGVYSVVGRCWSYESSSGYWFSYGGRQR